MLTHTHTTELSLHVVKSVVAAVSSFAIKLSQPSFRPTAALVTITRRRGGDLAFVLTLTKRGGFLRRRGGEKMRAATGLELMLRIRRGIRLVGTLPESVGVVTSESEEISMTSADRSSCTPGKGFVG